MKVYQVTLTLAECGEIVNKSVSDALASKIDNASRYSEVQSEITSINKQMAELQEKLNSLCQ